MTPSAKHVRTSTIDWVPLRAGLAMRPLHFEHDGYVLQLKVEPGATIAIHRHTGEIHALNLSGSREIVTSGDIVGPGDYVYEPPGSVDTWRCHGSEPCVILITQKGRVEYLGPDGSCLWHSDRDTALKRYVEHCAETGVDPDPGVLDSAREISPT